jgi:hypothetical protein
MGLLQFLTVARTGEHGRWAARVNALAPFIVCSAMSACTLLSDFAITECDQDVQCAATSGAVEYCDRGLCVPGCRDNRQCVARDPRTPLCTRTGGECVVLSSPELECYASSPYDDRTMGGATAEDLTIIGAFAPTLRSSTWLTLELAEQEFRASELASSADGPAPLMLVLCDDAPGAIQGSVEHLVDELSARAVLASFDQSVQSASLLAAGERAFLLSPDGALGGSPTPAFWHLAGDYTELTPAYPPLLDALVRRMEQRTAASGRPSRIAAVTSPGDAGRLGELVSASLRVDGQTPKQLEVPDRFRSFELSDEERASNLSELLMFAPDLVLLNATGVFGSSPRRERAEVIGRLEAEAAAAGRVPPLYVIGPRQAGDTYLDLLAARDASFRARAVLVDFDQPGRAEDAALRARFATTYQSPLPGSYLGPAARIYDAFYYLAYAATAGRSPGSLTTASVRRGMALVTDPTGVEVHVGAGSEGLDRARELLLDGTPFALSGITGGEPFDPARGLRDGSVVAQCWGDDGLPQVLARFDGTGWNSEAGSCASEAIDGPLD